MEMICPHCNKQMLSKEKISFRERCPVCGGPLHICKSCCFYDETAYNSCREISADRVVDKERSNFCEYFQPGSILEQAAPSDAKKKFDDLFT